MSYNPALDGIRAIAVMLVILFHARAPGFLGGYLGVDLFFVLSGFLVTGLLLQEFKHTGNINMHVFWKRRMWRLWPALLTMCLVFSVLASSFWIGDSAFLQSLVAATFLADYGVAFFGVPNEIGHTWSLAVEMQFYLLWPFILIFILRKKPLRLLLILGIAYVVLTCWRVQSTEIASWQQTYYRFDTRVSGLFLGAWLAVALTTSAKQWLLRHATALALVFSTGLALVVMKSDWRVMTTLSWGVVIAEWCAVGLILVAVKGGSILATGLGLYCMSWIGKLSYSLYLWHYPIFRYLKQDYTWETVLVVGLPISFAASIASYHFIENRFRRGFRTNTHGATSAT